MRRSVAIASCGLVLAILARTLFDALGVPLHFATFLPAVLMAAFLAGILAGALVAVLAIPIVWWAFLPPAFEFNPLTPADYHNFFLFLLCSALMVWFAQLYREALVMLRNSQTDFLKRSWASTPKAQALLLTQFDRPLRPDLNFEKPF